MAGLGTIRGTGSQSGIFRPAGSVSPGSLLEMQIFDPILDLLNQKLWGWEAELSIFTNFPGNSNL